MVTTYGKIRARDLKRNLINISRPWNPDMDIQTVFNHGALCRELAAKGGNPITDAGYVLILVKIFQESGVFQMEIREWSRLPEEDKTVARCMSFFTEAFENCMEETLQGTLMANTATVPPNNPTGKWDYCWSHGLCQHNGTTCKYPAPNHKQEATLDDPMGGSAQIRFPGPHRPIGRQRRNDTTQPSDTTTTTKASAAPTIATHVSSLTDE